MAVKDKASWQDAIRAACDRPDLIAWIEKQVALCLPDHVELYTGTESHYKSLCELLVAKKTFIPLKRENSYLARSDVSDVARTEERTFICSRTKQEAGPTNNWEDPTEMRKRLSQLFAGCMRGRTCYIIPFCMGPLGSDISQIGIQLTDSAYATCNMHITTRTGLDVLHVLGSRTFVPCMHSVGAPLTDGRPDTAWPCNKQDKVIAHFPEDHEIWSYGSGYGGNALLGKKCFALRIATKMAQEEGWLAEHMLILGLKNPQGQKKYIAAAFPSSCGKTNLAMVRSQLPGWEVTTVGDDICWMKLKADGRLWAINPEAGIFGVAPGTSEISNPNAMACIAKNTIFTNVALTEEGDVWWEGLSPAPTKLRDWRGQRWIEGAPEPAAHPNARFTAPLSQCPCLDSAWNSPEGVPISAILFGGRRPDTIPLVSQSLSWAHGVLMGASLASLRTAAADGKVGELRRDPFAMLPFCGTNMASYFKHWLSFADKSQHLPQIFSVNWFLKDEKGAYLWPGFSKNVEVLKWIFERCDNATAATKTAIGYVPQAGTFSCQIPVDRKAWLREVASIRQSFTPFGSALPPRLEAELDALEARLQ